MKRLLVVVASKERGMGGDAQQLLDSVGPVGAGPGGFGVGAAPAA
jgi:hypothetical protein